MLELRQPFKHGVIGENVSGVSGAHSKAKVQASKLAAISKPGVTSTKPLFGVLGVYAHKRPACDADGSVIELNHQAGRHICFWGGYVISGTRRVMA